MEVGKSNQIKMCTLKMAIEQYFHRSSKNERMRDKKRKREMSKNLNLQREMHNSKLNYTFSDKFNLNHISVNRLRCCCCCNVVDFYREFWNYNYLLAHKTRAPCTTFSSLHRWRCNFRCVNNTNGKTNKPRNILISRTFHNGISPETVVLLIFILFCWSVRVYLSRSEWKIL